MIAIDTNVLVRLVTDDNPRQAQLAQEALEGAARDGQPLVIVHVVLCELVWVLTRGYGYTKAQCLDVLERLLGFGGLSFESRQVASAATKAWRSSQADFSDAIIGLTAAGLGAQHVLTFDKKACSLAPYRLIA
jgi:predicted nucleic-acid-binding protein